MIAILVRVGLLAGGMAAVEIGLGDALARGSTGAWALVLLIGLPMLIAGSAGFIAPLLGGATTKDVSTDA